MFNNSLRSFRNCNFLLQRCLVGKNISIQGYFNSNPRYEQTCFYTSCYKEKDPGPLFFEENVQSILKKLTGCNLGKVFKNRDMECPGSTEEYKFFTKEDLKEYMDHSIEEAKRLLQMPPVVKIRESIDEVLSRDPAIQNPEVTSNLVITDISLGTSDRSRIIVVREPNGTLRQANWDERDRMNQIYNPRTGRFMQMPPAFEEGNLERILDRGDYVFILTFAAAQFEPDDGNFHRVTNMTFDHVRQTSSYEELHSTRFYGPMCFYFAWNKHLDDIILYYIRRENVEAASDLACLHYLIHHDTKAAVSESLEDRVALIKKYIKEEGKQKPNLQHAIQSFEEAMKERKSHEEAIRASHGFS